MTGRRSKILLDATIGSIAVGLMRAIKRVDRQRAANFAGALLRKAGPLFKEHRIGRAQLRAAFPEKSDAEIEKILAGVWDNLGRVAAEFVHLDEFAITHEGANGQNAVTMGPETRERAQRILNSSQVSQRWGCVDSIARIRTALSRGRDSLLRIVIELARGSCARALGADDGRSFTASGITVNLRGHIILGETRGLIVAIPCVEIAEGWGRCTRSVAP